MRKRVTRVFQLASFVAGFFLSSLPCPASLTTWPKMVIVSVYLIVLIIVRPNKLWINILIVAFLIIGLTFGFYYWVSLDSRSINVNGQIHVKGQLTKEAKDYLEKHPSVTEKEYFVWTGKKESEVWTPESIRNNKLFLGGLYSLFVSFVGFGIFGALEISARSDGSRSHKRKPISCKLSKKQKEQLRNKEKKEK
jgi:hypothetical protein